MSCKVKEDPSHVLLHPRIYRPANQPPFLVPANTTAWEFHVFADTPTSQRLTGLERYLEDLQHLQSGFTTFSLSTITFKGFYY